MLEFIKDSAKLQEGYQKICRSGGFSKKALCDLCVPFRDKYRLTDLQTLKIARKELDLSEIIATFEARERREEG